MNADTAKTYAVAYLRNVEMGAEIIGYIERIDETLTPFGGRFLVHGGNLTALEGVWDGDIVILEFPDGAAAQAWYDSPGYRDILPLRVEHSDSIACLVEGVPESYRAADKLAALR